MTERKPPGFFLKGILALVVLLLATLAIPPGPEVNALCGLIAVGLVIAVGKMLLRYYNVDWPPRRR